jgi:hypothetical protein
MNLIKLEIVMSNNLVVSSSNSKVDTGFMPALNFIYYACDKISSLFSIICSSLLFIGNTISEGVRSLSGRVTPKISEEQGSQERSVIAQEQRIATVVEKTIPQRQPYKMGNRIQNKIERAVNSNIKAVKLINNIRAVTDHDFNNPALLSILDCLLAIEFLTKSNDEIDQNVLDELKAKCDELEALTKKFENENDTDKQYYTIKELKYEQKRLKKIILKEIRAIADSTIDIV